MCVCISNHLTHRETETVSLFNHAQCNFFLIEYTFHIKICKVIKVKLDKTEGSFWLYIKTSQFI